MNGILLGKICISNHGDIALVNHTTGDVCQIKYAPPPPYFSKEPHNKVQGVVRDSHGLARCVLEGIVTEQVECSKVLNPIQTEDLKDLSLGKPTLVWKRVIPP